MLLKSILALCSAAAGLIGLGYLSAQGAWLLIAVGVVHTAALAPLPPLSDTLALGAAAPIGSGGSQVEIPLRLAARVRLGRLCRRLGDVRPGHRAFRHRRHRLAKRGVACLPRHPWRSGFRNYWRAVAIAGPQQAKLAGS